VGGARALGRDDIGPQVVAHGKVLTMDYAAASRVLEAAQKRSLARTPDFD